MKRLQKVMDIQFRNLNNKDWDNVIIVAGDEGVGKSNLNLAMLEYWLNLRYGCCKPEHIKFMNLDVERWAESLANCSKADMNVWDEGGEMSGKRAMSKLNFAISRAYQIIRGDNINSIICLPDVFWLDKFFTGRRARGFIYVYARGRFAYWSKDRLRKMIALNARRIIKSVWVVKPTFHDTFPMYKGGLLDAYKKLKADYMKDTRKELAETIREIKGGDQINMTDEKIKELKHQGWSNVAIGKELGLSDVAIGKKYSKILEIELRKSNET